ncbi:MAG TPA: hypothetical protein VGF13_08695 [Verrucomicrobiae bacterium]
MIAEENNQPNILQMMAAAKLESMARIRKGDCISRFSHPVVVIGVEAPVADILNCDSHYTL